MTVFAYCRVSRGHQDFIRQQTNIKKVYPDIKDNRYYCDKITGKSKADERPELKKLIARVKEGDTIVFDSVSRLSRDAESGYQTYQELYSMGVNLVFLNEPLVNTENYRQALNQHIASTGNEIADCFIDATNKVLMILAKKQVIQAFEQAQKEREDIAKRVKDGMDAKRKADPNIKYGLTEGVKLTTKKSVAAKEVILKHSKDFNGTLADADVIKLAGISRNSFYKYKAEIKAEIEQESMK